MSQPSTRCEAAAPGPGTWAVLGLGGLGHLAVQYASKMGFRVAGITRGADKAAFAAQLGAPHYIDSLSQDPAAELAKLGGAKVILATATSAEAMQACIGGLGPRGTFLVVGAVPKLEVPPPHLIGGNQSARGWYSGTGIDSQDTLEFSASREFARSMRCTPWLALARRTSG